MFSVGWLAVTDKAGAFLDAAERVWFRDGHLGLTARGITREATDGSGQTIYTNWGSVPGLIAAMFERVVVEVSGLLDSCHGATTWGADPVDSLFRYWHFAAARPALMKVMATGYGPDQHHSDDLDGARARLLDLVGSQAGVEALHGMIAGVIAGRWHPSIAEREAAIAAVLAMSAEVEA
jgi:AcrR family transcriptional regulator